MVFILLDTNIVQRMLSYGEFLFDYAMEGSAARRVSSMHGEHELHEINALREILFVAKRGGLPVAISEKSLDELSNTPDPAKRGDLVAWAVELRNLWLSNKKFLKLTPRKIAGRAERHMKSGRLDFLPDEGDRRLIAEAIALGCDTFLTMDRRTVLRDHRRLHDLGIDALSPYQFVQKYRDHLAAA
jgi:hypothetical protein